LGDIAGTHYAELIKDQLQRERDRKDSFEKRAEWVVASSGSLTTVLLAIAAFVTKVEGFSLASWPRALLIATLLFFLICAMLAIRINRPVKYMETTIHDLEGIVIQPSYWKADESIGLRRTAENRVGMLDAARTANNRKAGLLRWCLRLQVAGISLLAGSVVLILIE
jgi:hypothetical protein